jgi:hypothetical protein
VNSTTRAYRFLTTLVKREVRDGLRQIPGEEAAKAPAGATVETVFL